MGLALIAAACSDSTDDATTELDVSADSAESADDRSEQTTATLREIESDGVAPPAFVDLPLVDKIDVFLETPGAALASNLAADMALEGDPRWGPWLIDLLRLGAANGSDEQVAGALAIISGVERPAEGSVIDDYRTYGQWVYGQAIDPGPGYLEWKNVLYGSIDEEFVGFFESITDDVLLGQIQWGGETRGGIPELNDPVRVSAAEADWMVADEIVFGTVIDGEAVAYPFRILGHHELANDTIGDTPVSLVFCTLCRTALLFDRRVDGVGGVQTIDFQTSGLLVNSNKIMVDSQTDTLWSHLEAVGLGGPLEGVELDQYPIETITWGEWVEAHPATSVLAIPESVVVADTGKEIDYAYEPDSAYRLYYDDPDVWFPIFDTPTADIGLKDSVIGVEADGVQLAISVEAIVAAGPRVFVVGDTPLLVVPGDSAGARVYDASGTGLADGDQPAFVVDGQGVVLDDGTSLDQLAVSQGLWFAWFGTNPDTDWWPRAG